MTESQTMMAKRTVGAKQASFKFLSASGATMMEVGYVGRSGKTLMMRGRLMGEFVQEIYLPVDQFVRMVVVSLRPGPVQFLSLAPIWGILQLVQAARTQPMARSMQAVIAFMLAFLILSPLLVPVIILAIVLALPIWLALAGVSLATGKFASTPSER